MFDDQTITVSEAAKRSRVNRSTMRSVLAKLDRQSGGRLLRRLDPEKPGSKFLVSLSVFNELFPGRAVALPDVGIDELERDISDAHDRIDSLALRADGQSRKLRQFQKKLGQHDEAIQGLCEASAGLLRSTTALVGG